MACSIMLVMLSITIHASDTIYIRINQLGYTSSSVKVAVAGLKTNIPVANFELIDVSTSKPVLKKSFGKNFGQYGPFITSYRLDFSEYKKEGTYYIRAGKSVSPKFRISGDVYVGTADFALKYMRQQRSGYNPFLKDSCHTKDGYIVYGPDSIKYMNVTGGWHDASDYLQYSTTSANATYHLLAAYRDFPGAFGDAHKSNGDEGSNGIADIVDEAKWGLDWLLKMHPQEDYLFNQIADDRDHTGYRLPTLDSVDYGYGKGNGRPVYFVTGEPQGLGKYKNRATGAASTAGKFTSAFALGASLLRVQDTALASVLLNKAMSAYQLGLKKPGVSQTAPNRAPYFYEEDNWVDDMELAAINLFAVNGDPGLMQEAVQYAAREKITPWLGADTARHYQWYPFHNFGHYEIARNGPADTKRQMIEYYKEGIEKVWAKAKSNAFYRGVPFIWCSNNLTTSFAIQCILYRQLSTDNTYRPLEQACIDWLFGCNPWGTSMVCGLPSNGDFPADPHSSLSEVYKYPIDGGLVDGPVYGSIYKNLIGIKLNNADEYAQFQSDHVVYHDDAGDYSTNEPTMDGTASLVYLLAALEQQTTSKAKVDEYEAIRRGDTTSKKIAIVFTADEFFEGAPSIANTLSKEKINASFFLTGNAYRNPAFTKSIRLLKSQGHYLGAHSDKHLLYADWNDRKKTLVTEEAFQKDIEQNFVEMKKFGIKRNDSPFFLPPYEWYNSDIAEWSKSAGLTLINFSPGTRSTADYTYPAMGEKYVSSDRIYKSILDLEKATPSGLNGFILLIHAGAGDKRTDKFFHKLPELIRYLKTNHYAMVRVDELLQ
ncbi:MAG: cellulase [Chitinophagaceae bacterium]|nr:MAG: cellulase [Chitinophagaceae bacterium]